MAAKIEFTVSVRGTGDVVLPVDVQATVVEVASIGQSQVSFTTHNPLTRVVSLVGLMVEVVGSAKDKLQATLLQNAMEIAPGGSVENSLTIEVSTPVVEGESATVAVTGGE